MQICVEKHKNDVFIEFWNFWGITVSQSDDRACVIHNCTGEGVVFYQLTEVLLQKFNNISSYTK